MSKPHPLADFRERRGLSRVQLADELGVTEATVCRWELGQRTPRGAMLQKVCEVTGIPAADIIGLADAHTSAPGTAR